MVSIDSSTTCVYIRVHIYVHTYIHIYIWHIYTIANENVFMRKARTLIIELRVQNDNICYHHSFYICMCVYVSFIRYNL